jgi:hypothetical protein
MNVADILFLPLIVGTVGASIVWGIAILVDR